MRYPNGTTPEQLREARERVARKRAAAPALYEALQALVSEQTEGCPTPARLAAMDALTLADGINRR